MEVEEVIEDFAEREGRRLAAEKGLEGMCLAEILSWTSLLVPQHTQMFQIICA